MSTQKTRILTEMQKVKIRLRMFLSRIGLYLDLNERTFKLPFGKKKKIMGQLIWQIHSGHDMIISVCF